jgi:hypothetical protein
MLITHHDSWAKFEKYHSYPHQGLWRNKLSTDGKYWLSTKVCEIYIYIYMASIQHSISPQ